MDTKQLRQKILDLAIRGKLVPQDPNDEPVSVLLERVKAEKERLIAEGKIKRSKKSATSSDKPHYADWNLPSGWVWVKLEDIAIDMADGPFGSNLKSSHYTTDREVRIIQLSNIGEYGWRDDNVRYTTFEHAKDIQRSIVDSGDIVIAKMMPAGRAIICPNKDKAYVLSSDAVKLKPSSLLNISYLLYAINSPLFQNQVNENVQGVTRLRTSIAKLKSYAFPLPPLNEQTRIVNSLVHYLSIIDNIQDSIESINGGIVQVKSKILGLAISGKLVAQDPSDEPAADLLQRVNPNAIVSTDKSHYNGQNLPNGWIQCKFSDLFNVRSARRVHKADWRSEGIPFYRAREIGKLSDLGTVDNDLYIDNLLYSEFAKSGVPQSGDIMITAVGTLGKTYIVRKGDKFYYKDGSVLCIENRNGIDPRYIEMFISSSHFKEQYIWESQGTTVATLTMDRINSYSFVLPPLNEQKRIVSKVDELFAVIDQIKQSLE